MRNAYSELFVNGRCHTFFNAQIVAVGEMFETLDADVTCPRSKAKGM